MTACFEAHARSQTTSLRALCAYFGVEGGADVPPLGEAYLADYVALAAEEAAELEPYLRDLKTQQPEWPGME